MLGASSRSFVTLRLPAGCAVCDSGAVGREERYAGCRVRVNRGSFGVSRLSGLKRGFNLHAVNSGDAQPDNSSKEDNTNTSDAGRQAGSGNESSSSPSEAHDDALFNATDSSMDWRTFRAKLVASSQATKSVSAPTPAQEAAGLEIWQDRISLENWALLASQNPRLAKEVPWVHPTGGPEAGGILVAAPSNRMGPDRRYWQTVVFLMHHTPGKGSWGLMLNRPSGYTIRKAMAQVNHVEAALSVFSSNAIYVGGFRSDGRSLYCLHGHNLPGAEEVMPGVYLGGMETAAERVLSGDIRPLDFRFFVGRIEWLPGKLEEEVKQGMWIPAACARSLILKQCILLPKPLWREMLELMGGEYADMSSAEYGEK